MTFQTSVATQPAPGIEGGFYGRNPHFTVAHPDEGMWVAGTPGPFIGRFAWANPANGQVTSAHPGAAIVRYGFVHRDQPVVVAGLLTQFNNQLVAGQAVDILEDAPMWARFAGGAAINQKVYMSYADGSCRAGATGAPATATGVTVTTASGTPNLTAVAGGTLAPGQLVTGTGIPAGAYIVSVNGTTAVLSANASASGTGVAVTQSTDFETAWSVRSTAGSNELAKISVRG